MISDAMHPTRSIIKFIERLLNLIIYKNIKISQDSLRLHKI